MQSTTQERAGKKKKYLFCLLLALSVVTCGHSGMAVKAGVARRASDARGHKKDNAVCWVWNQDNNSVSAVQMRPGCSVPARYWLFECLRVPANLEQSGTEDTASPTTVHCPPPVISNSLCALKPPAWGLPLLILIQIAASLPLFVFVFVHPSVLGDLSECVMGTLCPFTLPLFPQTCVAAEIAR